MGDFVGLAIRLWVLSFAFYLARRFIRAMGRDYPAEVRNGVAYIKWR